MKNKILLYCCILCLQVQAQDYQGVDEFALTDTRVSGIIDDKLPPMAIPATEREQNFWKEILRKVFIYSLRQETILLSFFTPSPKDGPTVQLHQEPSCKLK